MSHLGLQLGFRLLQDGLDLRPRNGAVAPLLENLDEPAHVRALETVRQVGGKEDRREHRLMAVLHRFDQKGQFDALHADPLKRYFPPVVYILRVNKSSRFCYQAPPPGVISCACAAPISSRALLSPLRAAGLGTREPPGRASAAGLPGNWVPRRRTSTARSSRVQPLPSIPA